MDDTRDPCKQDPEAPASADKQRPTVQSGSQPRQKRRSKDRLHGVTLEMILIRLVNRLGWSEMARHVKIRCFSDNPSIQSSLKFLRKTPWAREKVERLYLKWYRG